MGKDAKNEDTFSSRLETLINSALQDGVLTDKEREIIKIIEKAIGTNNEENILSNEITNSNGEGKVIYLNGGKSTLSTAQTSIGECEFANVVNIEKIILPSTILEIDYRSFYNCKELLEVDFSQCKGIKKIGEEAFYETKIKEMVIPDSVETIGPNTFTYCEDLKTIVMPASLKELKGTLGSCMGQLKKIDFSKVKNLNSIPKEFIGWSCRKLKELIIPYGVTEIEDDAFRYSYALKRLFLPPTLKIIGDLMREDDEGYPLRTGLSVFCYSPSLEELEPIVYGWDDEEDLEEEEEEENDGNQIRVQKKTKINLYILPQYLDKYINQRNAEEIPEDVLIISPMPDEYLYFYDN